MSSDTATEPTGRRTISAASLRRSMKRRPTPASPAARFDPGHIGEPKHRNPLWLAGGLLLVVVCGLGGVLLFTSADDRVPVAVSAGELEPGRPLTRADLRVVDMTPGDGIDTLSPDDASALLGQLPVGRIPAGTLLNSAMFVPEVPLAPGEMVFGAALDPGEAPLSDVDVGATVELLFAPKRTASDAGAGDDESDGQVPTRVPRATSIGTGDVWAVETLADGRVWVSVRVSKSTGLVASQADQDDALRIALAGGQP